jgi:hypothetical protein
MFVLRQDEKQHKLLIIFLHIKFLVLCDEMMLMPKDSLPGQQTYKDVDYIIL